MANPAAAWLFPRTVEIDRTTGAALAERLTVVNAERVRRGLRPLTPAQFARLLMARSAAGDSTFHGE